MVVGYSTATLLPANEGGFLRLTERAEPHLLYPGSAAESLMLSDWHEAGRNAGPSQTDFLFSLLSTEEVSRSVLPE